MNVNNINNISKNIMTNNFKNIDKDNTFNEFLQSSLKNVNELQTKAGDYKKSLATGEVDNVHSVMIATEKADLALQLTLNIRNKVMDAYKEIMRMQI